MITLFFLGIIILVVNLIVLAIKLAWGLLKAVLGIALLPLTLLGLLFGGLVKAAVALLLIFLVITFVGTIFADKKKN